MSTVTEQQSRHGQVQSLIFSKEHFTRDEALAWAKEHDFKAGKVHKTENSYRLRQFDPGACESFRSKRLTTGVTAVICLTGEILCTKEEAFNWLAPIEAEDSLQLPPFSIKIVALHAGMTRNLTEYTANELIRGARTFIDQPIYFGTSHSPEDKESVGHIYWAEEEDKQLELLGHIPLAPALWQQIRDGEISQGSVELGCLFLPPIMGGHACQKLVGRGFLITPPGVELGDPETHIEVVETLTRLGETLATSETQSQSQDSGQKVDRMNQTREVFCIDVLGEACALRDLKLEKIPREEYYLAEAIWKENVGFIPREGILQKIVEAVWTTKYINDLPDSAFAYIESGGEKDEEAKTKPRSLRHLPYKDKDGDIDEPHLANAIQRLPQTDIPTAAKAKALRKLCAAAKSIEKEYASCEAGEVFIRAIEAAEAYYAEHREYSWEEEREAVWEFLSMLSGRVYDLEIEVERLQDKVFQLALSETRSGKEETRLGEKNTQGENAKLVQEITETVQKTFDEKISGMKKTFNKKVDEILGSLGELKKAGESLENTINEFIGGDFKKLNGRVETLESSRPSRRTFSEAATRGGGGRGLVEANAAATEEPKTSVSFADIQLGEVFRRKG